ncbi:MAG: peptidase M61 [Flavisolibacter sp.]|jgi:predicted metalloprotease with PDZ domain|nr:peptidase M61 [Flavisolibacter sp.]
MKKALALYAFLFLTFSSYAQNEYRYSIDLNKVEGDKLAVELLAPSLGKGQAIFSFPKIIPGTYSISDYGKFIHDVQAFDKAGKAIKVERLNDNQWSIRDGASVNRVTYKVEDIFDTEIKNGIYPMAATNIEEGKNFVFNTPGVFGFFEGHGRLPFQVSIVKPAGFFASTSLKPVAASSRQDVFKVSNVDDLYDAPIMYTIPDTTTIRVGNTEVVVSVYSPSKGITSAHVAEWLSDLLFATKDYLGGRLPAERYAFLYYFKDPSLKHSFPPGVGGALEHNASSFYYLSDLPAAQLKNTIVNISSHEFFHIITPLNIASREVKEFNYAKPVLSKHLWLYEGTTEYTAHHVQVKQGLTTPKQFLGQLSGKITNSRKAYNDSLSFTVMSKQAADKYEKEYGNVYQKGALIGACLDIYLLHLSGGTYGLRNLTYDLGIRYGKNKAFDDEKLFDEIADLSYPEIKTFLEKYVAGNEPIPYEDYFSLAGIRLTPRVENEIFSLGGFAPGINKKGNFFVTSQSKINEFGKKLGLNVGDELYAINNVHLSMENLGRVIDSIKRNMQVGQLISLKVGRSNASGVIDTLMLTEKIFKVKDIELNKLEPVKEPTRQQQLVYNAWLVPANKPLAQETPVAKPADVATIDAIVQSLYDVISGPAGPRDWQRFNSLFLPDGKMGAVLPSPAGQSSFVSFSPDQYKKMNASTFTQSGFYEEELGRSTRQFGNISVVESAYQYRFTPGGQVMQRGINYITLVKSAGRWWISTIFWQDENEANPIPASLITKKVKG